MIVLESMALPDVVSGGPEEVNPERRLMKSVYTNDAPITTTIPAEMRSYRSWVCYRLEEREGEEKPTKVPYDPVTGFKASHSDSRTWRSFDEAEAALEVGGYDGLGFVFSSGDPYTGIDLDGCRSPETAELEDWAERIVAAFGGYAEASPSGRGVHVIVKGRLPDGVKHRIERADGRTIEAYSERRFFTVTGRAL